MTSITATKAYEAMLAGHAGEYTWDYLEAGPTVWRVRIGRAGA